MKFFESEVTELKRKLNKGFAKEVVAFLNSRDGNIYIGVDDDGSICGVIDIDKTMREVRDIIRDQILPSTDKYCQIGSLLVDDKQVVYVNVKKGEGLFYLKKEGRSSAGCFYRDGSVSIPMKEEEIEARFVQSYKRENDVSEMETNLKELSFTQLQIYYAGKGFHLNSSTFMDNLLLKNKNGNFTLLGEMLSDENRISIKLAKFASPDKSRFLEKTEYGHKCILSAIDRCLDRLAAENIVSSSFVGPRRIDTPLFDMSVVREAFVNAIAHNDYSISEPIVYLYSNRLEIFSYGGLPKGESLENFYAGISLPRNKGLMRVLSDLGYVEKMGFGVPKIIETYGKQVFLIEDSFINVVIPFTKRKKNKSYQDNVAYSNYEPVIKVKAKSSPSSKDIIKLIKKNPHISKREMGERLGISIRVIDRLISNSKKIKHFGPDKGGEWRIIEE